MKNIFLVIGIIILLFAGIYGVLSATNLRDDQSSESLASEEVEKYEEFLSEEKSPEEVIGTQIGNTAMDFDLKDLKGNVVKLSDFKGKKVVLNFWTTWCPGCEEEMPVLNDFYAENKEKVVVLAVNIGEERNKVAKYMKDNDYNFPVLLDIEQIIAYDYRIMFTPSTFFIDENGIIFDNHIGPVSIEQLNELFLE